MAIRHLAAMDLEKHCEQTQHTALIRSSVLHQVLYGKDGSVQGVVTGDFGVGRDGSKKDNFTLGMALTADITLLAEGCRGSLSQVCQVSSSHCNKFVLIMQVPMNYNGA